MSLFIWRSTSRKLVQWPNFGWDHAHRSLRENQDGESVHHERRTLGDISETWPCVHNSMSSASGKMSVIRTAGALLADTKRVSSETKRAVWNMSTCAGLERKAVGSHTTHKVFSYEATTVYPIRAKDEIRKSGTVRDNFPVDFSTSDSQSTTQEPMKPLSVLQSWWFQETRPLSYHSRFTLNPRQRSRSARK